MLKIVHIINKHMPPPVDSGGVNRMVEWLARAQHEHGHEVTLVSPTGSNTDYANHIPIPTDSEPSEFRNRIPADTDIIHHHDGYQLVSGHPEILETPFIQTVHGNLKDTEGSRKNAVYVSRTHMRAHSGSRYVLNGIPIQDYTFSDVKDNQLLFLAKVRRSKKGIAGAIKVAKELQQKLIVAGGWRLGSIETWLPVSRLIKAVGRVEGAQKFQLLAKSKALLAPIEWDEPFGLTVIEAMASGTPVIALNNGAMAELIKQGQTGFICDSLQEMCAAVERLDEIKPLNCRQYAEELFSIERACLQYEQLYENALAGDNW